MMKATRLNLERIILHESKAVLHTDKGEPYRVLRGIGVHPVFYRLRDLLAKLKISSIYVKYDGWLNSVLINVSKEWMDKVGERARVETQFLQDRIVKERKS